jgi:hypothetical protein
VSDAQPTDARPERSENDGGEGDVLVGVRSGRVHHTPAHGVQGYDPSDPDSVALAETMLKARLKSGTAPVLVHEDPGVFTRFWRFFFGN